MTTLTYFRGTELVTKKQKALATKMWGLTPYVYFVELPLYQAIPTGIKDVMEILLFIENDRYLNERSDKLKERIAKGLTHSTAYYSDYVETNLLWKLLKDAIHQYNKTVSPEDQILDTIYKYGEEFKRLYKLPLGANTFNAKFKKHSEKLAVLPDLTLKYKFKYKTKYNTSRDQMDIFKEYCIKGRFNKGFEEFSYKAIFGDLAPFVAKVHNVQSDGYFQLYVYDNAKSNKVVMKALDMLLEKHLIHLEM